VEIDIVQPNFTDELAAGLNCPGMWMLDKLSDPSRGIIPRHSIHAARIDAEHLDYFCGVAERQARVHIAPGCGAEPKSLSCKYG
jgi:hypothetical protein